MINGKIAVYLLICSYILTLGHNFIPHHHHHKGQDNSTHFGLHHAKSEGENNKDHDHDSNGFLWIFSNILHHDDDGFIVHSSSENEGKSVSSGNAFGLCSSNTVFENFPFKNSRKHPPENKNYFKLDQKHSHGLRAPPYTIS